MGLNEIHDEVNYITNVNVSACVSVCQEVIHLDDKKLVSYKGNYDNFKEQEAVKLKQQLKDWEKQEKKLRELKAKGG